MKRLLLLSLLFLLSCMPKMDVPCTKAVPSGTWTQLNQTQLQQDIQAIDAYLTTNNITAIKDPSGLRYVITIPGTGDGPCLENLVVVTYTGKLLSDATVFDSTIDPVAFYLNQLIAGWQIGFLKLNKGARATLYIPSGLAYGTVSQAKIPANSNLVFDVELVSFQ